MNYRKLGLAIATTVLLTAALAVSSDESGDGTIDTPPPMPDFAIATDGDPLSIGVPCNQVEDAATRDACWRALTQRFNYFASGMDHRTRVFEWQHLSSRIIFVFVLMLVSAGLVFSYMQFRVYLRRMMRPAAREESSSDKKMDTDLEISSGGLKVSSNVLGVIILTLSLAFFYLYLVHVFPISDTF